MATDAIVVAISLAAAIVLRFGDETPAVRARTGVTGVGNPATNYLTFSVLLFVAWMLALHAAGARSPRVLGSGTEEYKRVARATFRLFGVLAIVAFFLRLEIARGYIGLAFPLGLLGVLVGRRVWRTWLARQRRQGRMRSKVLVLGPTAEAQAFARELARNPAAGLQASELLTEHWLAPGPGWAASIAREAESLGVDAIAVTPGSGLDNARIHELLYALEIVKVDILLSSSMTGVAGPRIQSWHVEGLPVWHIEGAHYRGAMRWVKAVVDRLGAVVLLVLFSPVLLVTAVLVKMSSPGPVFYRQERIGVEGRTFRIWKFRSMRADADSELMALLLSQGTNVQPLFKVSADPRVTPVGALLRRYSVDELPQLLNVLAGDMSLVGPRPQRPAEVALYDNLAGRRLTIKPGLTGLWQVSGRSDLPWSEAVRLDVYYVDNWSLLLDLQLLWRTAFVVTRGTGAR